MKKLKKVMFVLLTVLFVLDTVEVSAANVLKNNGAEVLENETEDKSIEYAKIVGEFFLLRARGNATLFNPIILKNVVGEEEACIFDISGGGYVIVNLNDLSIPEYSPEGINPYIGIDNPVYNGPFNYYYFEGDNLISINSGDIVCIDNTRDIYRRDELDDKEEYINRKRKSKLKRSQKAPIKRYIKNELVTYRNPTRFACGATAAAICLKYYHDNVDTNYIKREYDSERALIERLRLQRYVGAAGTYDTDLKRGLNQWFEDYDINDSTDIYNYSFFSVKAQINKSKPIMVWLDETYYEAPHWVVIYGYFEDLANGSYIIVNPGWGYNGVWIEADTSALQTMLYFTRHP